MGESAPLAGQTASHYRILEMRSLDGMSVEEIADVIGASRNTVKREWAIARAGCCGK